MTLDDTTLQYLATLDLPTIGILFVWAVRSFLDRIQSLENRVVTLNERMIELTKQFHDRLVRLEDHIYGREK